MDTVILGSMNVFNDKEVRMLLVVDDDWRSNITIDISTLPMISLLLLDWFTIQLLKLELGWKTQ